ncbi:MAG: adenylate/guanylate cyclase domain-containing protein, partial [Alphaproteobacteria bacterium]
SLAPAASVGYSAARYAGKGSVSTAVERRLTTVLCADVKGYSRLMDADEEATLATLKEYRDAIGGFVERHRGRVVSTAGDSMLAEFASVVEAVQCAVEIQRELAVRNDRLSRDRRMDFRIGINLGDVMVDGSDLFGEGVNIASRLEGLAEPGGICISGTVYDQIKNKLTLGYDFLGRRSVKNITEEVPVYRVLMDGQPGAAPRRRDERDRADPQAADSTPPQALHAAQFGRRAGRAAVLIVFLFIIDLFTGRGWWVHWPAAVILALVALDYLRKFGPETRRGHHRRRGR